MLMIASMQLQDRQALLVAVGKPSNPQPFGDLADTYVSTALRAATKYEE